MNIDKSTQLFERSKALVPGGVHSPVRAFRGVGGVPRFMESAKGAYIYDVDGNSYLDFCMSWGPLIFGHQDPDVKESVRRALDRGFSFGTAEPYSLELAEFMCARIPWLEKVRFVNSGTEAVMSAVRVARGATGRDMIVKFDGCYHGHVDSLMVKAGSGLAEMTSPDSAGVPRAMADQTWVLPLNNIEAFQRLMNEKGTQVAAVIVEPLPANNGLLPQSVEFLRALSEGAKKAGALLLFDEVISGFRVAFGGMAELTGIRPDLVTYGKVIGGGFPVGAYGGRRDLMELVAPAGPVYQAGTLSANPVAMAAGLTMLQKLDKEKPYQILEKRTAQLAQLLEEKAKAAGSPVRVQKQASLFWLVEHSAFDEGYNQTVRSIAEIPVDQKSNFARLFHSLLGDGIYLAPSGYEVGFLSTVHSDAHIQQLGDSFARSISRPA